MAAATSIYAGLALGAPVFAAVVRAGPRARPACGHRRRGPRRTGRPGVGLRRRSSPDARPELTLALDFTPNAVHAPIYAAVREGFDRAAGVRLRIRAPGASPDSLKDVLSGAADVGVLDIHDLGLAVIRGKDVVAFAALVQRPLAAIITTADVRRPRDLEGRRVGVSGLPSDPAVLDAVMRDDGGDIGRVAQVTIGFTAVQSLVSGRIAGVPAFWNAEGVALRRRGVPIHEFRVEDYGAPRYPEVVAGHPPLDAARAPRRRRRRRAGDRARHRRRPRAPGGRGGRHRPGGRGRPGTGAGPAAGGRADPRHGAAALALEGLGALGRRLQDPAEPARRRGGVRPGAGTGPRRRALTASSRLRLRCGSHAHLPRSRPRPRRAGPPRHGGGRRLRRHRRRPDRHGLGHDPGPDLSAPTTSSAFFNGGTEVRGQTTCVAPACDEHTLTVGEDGAELLIDATSNADNLSLEIIDPDGSRYSDNEVDPTSAHQLDFAPDAGEWTIRVYGSGDDVELRLRRRGRRLTLPDPLERVGRRSACDDPVGPPQPEREQRDPHDGPGDPEQDRRRRRGRCGSCTASRAPNSRDPQPAGRV